MKRVALLWILLVGALLLRGASADAPRPLLRGLPQGAHAMLESEDLRALLVRWRDAPLRKAFQKSGTSKEMERNKLFLRLLSRLEALEEITGYAITLDRLIKGAGKRFALGLYDIGETSFVLVTELPLAEAKKSDLLGLRGRLGSREHQGVAYLVSEGAAGKKRPPLCVALLGSRLLVGNDVPRFQDALLLTAQELGLPLKTTAAPQRSPRPFTEDSAYTRLQPAAQALQPRSALRIYLARSALSGNRYFDRYWLFGRASAEGIDAALLSLSLGEVTTETRAYVYQAGAQPPQLAAYKGDLGSAEVPRLLTALPAKVPYAQATLTTARDAAAIIADMLPLPGAEGKEPGRQDPAEVRGSLEQALFPAAPFRAVEIADLVREGLVVRHRSALALALRRGDALSAAQLERALLQGIEEALGVSHGGPELEFATSKTLRSLHLPLIPEWALSWERRGDVLYIGTDQETVEQLSTALAGGTALAADGPLLRRIDLDRAGTHFRAITRLLVQRDAFSDGGTADLYDKAVAGIPEMVRPIRRVLSASYRHGPFLVEEVHYLQ